jgi:hypothetical protein
VGYAWTCPPETAVFQTGISWKVVEAKWPGTRQAMKCFVPLAVSKFSGSGIDRLMQDTHLMRNRRKLEGIVLNARKMLELDKAFKGFRTYLRSQGTFAETTAALHRDFKFMGESGAYYFLWVLGRKSLHTRNGWSPAAVKGDPPYI